MSVLHGQQWQCSRRGLPPTVHRLQLRSKTHACPELCLSCLPPGSGNGCRPLLGTSCSHLRSEYRCRRRLCPSCPHPGDQHGRWTSLDLSHSHAVGERRWGGGSGPAVIPADSETPPPAPSAWSPAHPPFRPAVKTDPTTPQRLFSRLLFYTHGRSFSAHS